MDNGNMTSVDGYAACAIPWRLEGGKADTGIDADDDMQEDFAAS